MELYRDEAVRSNGNGPFFRRSVCIQKRKTLITATQINSDGSSKVVAYVSVIATTKKIEAVRLLIDGQDITNGSFTVAGSETKKIQVQENIQGR